jgi:hypothetical protein
MYRRCPPTAQLLPLLGEDYERKCLELGIIQRASAIKTPADLMMLCLFHLLNGVPLMAASTRVCPENREFQ